MNIILNKGKGRSLATELNFVAQKDKIYVTDNRLAAIWFMAQLDTSKKYNFLHIDRHYDLSPSNNRLHASIHSIDLKKTAIEDIPKFKETVEKQDMQVFIWNNYINLFNEKFPNTIEQAIFVTHKVGEFHYKTHYKELEIYQLFAEEFKTKDKWIFNIDIDYFFSAPDDETIQLYTDEYIEEFAKWLADKYQNAEQIIICLSPKCCGGWENSERILDILMSYV